MQIEINLKKSWNAVTVAEYLQYKAILEGVNVSQFEKFLEICVLFSDKTREDFLPLPISVINSLFEKLSFLQEVPKSTLREFYDIGDVKYKLISSIEDLTAGQFIDLSHYTKDETEIINNVAEICSIFLMPVIEYRGKKDLQKIKVEKYQDTPIEKTISNLQDNMLITEALSISNFFTLLSIVYAQTTKEYLEETSLKQKKQALRILRENSKTLETKEAKEMIRAGITQNGIGSQPLTTLLEEIEPNGISS